jgi:hypothetical protein
LSVAKLAPEARDAALSTATRQAEVAVERASLGRDGRRVRASLRDRVRFAGSA